MCWPFVTMCCKRHGRSVKRRAAVMRAREGAQDCPQGGSLPAVLATFTKAHHSCPVLDKAAQQSQPSKCRSIIIARESRPGDHSCAVPGQSAQQQAGLPMCWPFVTARCKQHGRSVKRMAAVMRAREGVQHC